MNFREEKLPFSFLRKQIFIILLCWFPTVEVIAMDQFYLDKGQGYIDNMEENIITFDLGRTHLSEVKKTLGVPSGEFASTTPKGSNMRITGNCIRYYVRKLNKNDVNLKHDKEYTFCFDLDGKLVGFWRSNITTPREEDDIDAKLINFTVNKTKSMDVRKYLGSPAYEKINEHYYPRKLEAGSIIFRYDIGGFARTTRIYLFVFNSKKILVDVYRHDV